MRRFRVASFAALATLGLLAPASARFMDWGWGGWGMMSATVEGHAMMGAGMLAEGLGIYNLNTAQAESINADTVMRLNEYLYQSSQVARENYFKRVAARRQLRNDALSQIEQQLLYTPSQADVFSGDALNAVLRQLQNPNVPMSVITNLDADITIPGDQIRLVPLKFASAGVVISLDRLSVDDRWPVPLRAQAFKPLHDEYSKFVADLKSRPEDDPIPDALVVRGIDILKRLREQARTTLQGRDFAAAERFLKGQLGMVQLLRQPDVRRVVERASQVKDVPLANAIMFMDVFNMQFGAARTPEERTLYSTVLHPKLVQLRDAIEKEMGKKIQTANQAARGEDPNHAPTEVFEGLEWDTLSRTEAPTPPPEPAK